MEHFAQIGVKTLTLGNFYSGTMPIKNVVSVKYKWWGDVPQVPKT